MKECGAFKLIWDRSSTIDKLVFASADIFKKLAQQQILDGELLNDFW